jgi:phosphatidate cytidylyltransferase
VAAAIRQASASLGPRLLTAIILAISAVAAVYAGGITFLAVVTGLTAIVTFEWIRMCCPRRSPGTLLLAIATVALSGAVFAVWDAEIALVVGAGGAVTVGAVAKFERNSPLWTAAGVFIFILSMVSIIWLRAEEAIGLATVYWLFVVVWATDSGAYIFGKLIGGASLAPRISPKKTWAGAIGGLATGALMGVVLTLLLQAVGLLGGSVELLLIALASALLSLCSQVGDLAESGVKRYFGVKDSGSWLPGHGGALDRLDSLILVAPILAFAVLLAGGSAALLTWTGN